MRAHMCVYVCVCLLTSNSCIFAYGKNGFINIHPRITSYNVAGKCSFRIQSPYGFKAESMRMEPASEQHILLTGRIILGPTIRLSLNIEWMNAYVFDSCGLYMLVWRQVVCPEEFWIV